MSTSTRSASANYRRLWSEHPFSLLLLCLGLAGLALALALTPGGQLLGGRLALGLVTSLLIGWLARRRGWLTASGHFGAVLTGSLTVGGGGLAWGGLLVIFFLLSSLLSRLRRRRKAALTAAAAKGAQRDLGQVLANGGPASGLAVLACYWPEPWLTGAFIGTLAAVTADTWSTELGLLGRRPPRLITTGRPVPAGTNGGVSWPGTLAGAAGGLTIGLAALALAVLTAGWPELAPPAGQRAWLPLLGLLAGLGGGLIDSLLGATLQVARWCPTCRQPTEQRHHHCGTPTQHRSGLAWLDNDRVNLLAALAGGLLGLLVAVSGRW